MDWREHSSKWTSALVHFQKLCGNEGFSVTVSTLVSQVLWQCSWELHPGQGVPASCQQASPAGTVQGLWEQGLQSPTAPAPALTELISAAIHQCIPFLGAPETNSLASKQLIHTKQRVFLKFLRNHHGSCQLLLCTSWGLEASRQWPALWKEGKGKPSAAADPWTFIAKLPSTTVGLAKLC